MKLYLIIYIVFTLVIDEVLAWVKNEEWIMVMISEDYLEKDTWAKRFDPKGKVNCASLCALYPECKPWCQNGQNRCTLSRTYVAPKYKELFTNLVRCYTRNRRDLAIESTSSESSSPYYTQTGAAAIDGVFLRDYSKIFQTKKENKPWVSFNLLKSAKISEVRIGIYHTQAPLMCDIYQVFIGETDSDMSIFNTESCKYERDVMSYKVSVSKKGKIIKVQRPEKSVVLFFEFIEIDGEYE